MDSGFAHLRAGETDAALALGHELLDMKYTGGVELVALAHQKRGEPLLAIERLEAGVAKAPSVWLLWQLLGNLRDDVGDRERALEAYEHGLACERTDRASLHFNRAVTLGRMDRFEEALADLAKAQSAPLTFELRRAIASQGVHCLVEGGRGTEAVTYVQRTFETLPEREKEQEAALRIELAWAPGTVEGLYWHAGRVFFPDDED